MLKGLIKKIGNFIISRNKVVCGATFTFVQDGKYTINAAVLSLKEGQITLLEKKENINTLIDLKTIIPKGVPIIISLAGRGVLHRKFEAGPLEKGNAIQQMLPNAKMQDFYIQNYSNDNGNYLSIVRRSIIDQLVNDLDVNNIAIVGLGIAPFTAIPAIEALLPGEVEVTFPGVLLKLKEGVFSDFLFSNTNSLENIKIGDEVIEFSTSMTYFSTLPYLLDLPRIEVDVPIVTQSKEDFFYKGVFQKLGVATMAVFFSVLLINFLSYAHFQKENQALSVHLGSAEREISKLTYLQQDLKEKRQFLETAGWLTPSDISLYADKIAGTIPNSVKLTAMNLYPLNEKESRDKKISKFDRKFIVLKGWISRSTDLNSWIRRIDKISGISDANVVNYSFDNKVGQGEFIININVKENGY